MAKKSSDARMNTLRWTILGFIGAVAVLVILYGMLYSTGATEGEFAEGEHYQEILTDVRRRPGAPVEVIEFFSYGCVHCMNFDPMIEEWAAEQADDVVFSRQPAMWSPIQVLLGQAYLTLEEKEVLDENHTRIFSAIHDRRKQFLTADMIGDHVDGRGISKDDFVRAFNSPRVKSAVRQAETEQREYKISATPSIVVAGKYVVGMGQGAGRALQVVDNLIAQIRAEDQSKG